MCGGRGSRLDSDREKPLVEVGEWPMIDRVITALKNSSVEGILAITTPEAPETAAHVDVPTIETPGEGYVADLQTALEHPRVEKPVLTVAADVPLLDSELVDTVLEDWNGGSLTVAVPAETKRYLGVSVDSSFDHEGLEVAPTGLNVVGGDPDRMLVLDNERLAVNVNRERDLRIARRLA